MTSRRSRTCLGLALACATAASPLAGEAGPWAENPQARVRLVSRWAAAASGGEAGLGLEYRLAPGWHVYWLNPGDAGYPPALTRTAGPVSELALRYPAPDRYDLPGGLVAFGYGDEVIYPVEATLDADAPSPVAIEAEVDYLVCADQCIPYRATLTLALPIADAPREDPEIAPALTRWRSRVPRAITAIPGARADGTLLAAMGPELDLELALTAPGLTADGAPELFFAPHPLLVVERPVPRAVDGAAAAWSVHLRPLDETKPLPERLELEWTAAGLTLDGAPLAIDGTLLLDRPISGTARRRWTVSLAVLAFVAYLIYRRLRARPVPPSP